MNVLVAIAGSIRITTQNVRKETEVGMSEIGKFILKIHKGKPIYYSLNLNIVFLKYT